ncbi:MAG: type II toxin-antitoxin system VapC family toxin [Planctomycetia bacterium]|nr:type II toxin-antitoxin system VapC family toxin [Planctomycetia bacterium]
MILLDTDHLTLLKYPDSTRCSALTARLTASPDQQIGTTIISAEEQLRGWLAVIARYRDVQRQVHPYEELRAHLDFYSRWTLLPFDALSASQFDRLRQQGMRIGSMDLKIASVALIHQALLLSANLSDFRRVPDLRVENWLD